MNVSAAKDELIFGKFVLADLPEMNSREFRLYICAPYTDTYQETSQLFNKVVIKLREFSMARYGVEFLVNFCSNAINLNWDVNLSEENQTDLNEESLLEIEKCKSRSIGMTFLFLEYSLDKDATYKCGYVIYELKALAMLITNIASSKMHILVAPNYKPYIYLNISKCLIADEYGGKLIPKWLDRETFSVILKSLKEKNINSEPLESCYTLNIGYSINKYELNQNANISSIFDLIETGVDLAVKSNNLSKEFQEELNRSSLERQILNGLVKYEPKTDRVFSFVRLTRTSTTTQQHPRTHTIENIRDHIINFNTPAEQIYRIRVDAIDDAYLTNLGNHYERLFKKLIDKFIQINPMPMYDDVFRDALNHANYVRLIGDSSNSKDTLKKLTDYVLEDKSFQPLILKGVVGSGKTSHLATLYSNLYLQLEAFDNSEHAIVARFIGIDQKSTYLRSLLKSICEQLYLIKKQMNKSAEQVPKKLTDLKTYFENVLTTEFSDNGSKLVIIIDSLNDLLPNDYSYKLDWLPTYLHPSCKLILSVSAESNELCERLNRKYRNENSYVNLNELNSEQAEMMVRRIFETKQCQVEREQMNAIKNWVVKKRVRSLHLKVLLEYLAECKVVAKEARRNLRHSLNSAIDELIKRLERKFGVLIVRHILTYITISHCGLSENELQDILSLDDEILKHYLSNGSIRPHSTYLRLPWYFILPVLNALSNYLLITSFYGINVFSWKHRIFSQIVFKKYLEPNPDFLIYVHKNISDYYLGKWSDSKSKPLSYKKYINPIKDPEKLAVDKPIAKTYHLNGIRLVPTQPIMYDEFHTQIKPRYNLRKLAQLPYHLIKAGYKQELFKYVFFNVEWLYSLIRAFDFYHLIYDFDMFKESVEVNLLCEFLKSVENALIEEPKLLFTLISGHLLPFYSVYENIRNLIDQCDEKAASLNPLIPITRMSNVPGWLYSEYIDLNISNAELQMQLELLEGRYNGRLMIVKELDSKVAKIFDLDQLEWTNELACDKGEIYCNKTGDYVCSIESSCSFIIKRIETGEVISRLEFEKSTIGSVYMWANYACILLRNKKSPLVIDLKSNVLTSLPYHTSFVCISNDERVLVVHSGDTLFYHSLPDLKLSMVLKEVTEIPEKIVLLNNNSDLVVLFKDTKQVIYYKLSLEKKQFTKAYVVQDPEIVDLVMSKDEGLLLVCASSSIYVFDTKTAVNSDQNISMRFKISSSSVENYLINTAEIYIDDSPYTGFGITSNNTIIFATIFAYLVCYDTRTGDLVRIFQSSISANKILGSYRLENTLVSLLDNSSVLVWNLNWLDDEQQQDQAESIKFDDMKIFSEPLRNVVLPQLDHEISSSLALTYTDTCPYAKIHSIKENLEVKSLLKVDADESAAKSCSINQLKIDDTGRYCYLEYDSENFTGKLEVYENEFVKKQCLLFDLKMNSQRIDLLTFIVRRNSSFRITPIFIAHNSQTYLLIRIVSSLADFDPYVNTFDWTNFESVVKLYGPLEQHESNDVCLVREVKLVGVALETDLCVTRSHILTSLMHECTKLVDEMTNEIKAKRFLVNLNLVPLFDNKPVQLLSANKILGEPNVQFLDLRSYDEYLFLLYIDPVDLEYDYENFKFKRDLCVAKKSAFIYDPLKHVIMKKIKNILNEESNVETMRFSRFYALDSKWNLFDLGSSGTTKTFKNHNFNFELSQFLFEGKFLITCEHDKILIIRTADLHAVASYRINDSVSLIRVGEADRTILIGSSSGSLVGFKFVFDLEHQKAVEKYIRFYRPSQSAERKALTRDIKRITQSANLSRAREKLHSTLSTTTAMQSSLSSCSRYSSSSRGFRRTHEGVARANLATISVGIKYANSGSKACSIQ